MEEAGEKSWCDGFDMGRLGVICVTDSTVREFLLGTTQEEWGWLVVILL